MNTHQLSLRRILFALASLLDYVEAEMLEDITNHGRRTAYTALRIGRSLGLSEQELFDLAACSLLHDIGIIQSKVLRQSSRHSLDVLKHFPDHCTFGSKALMQFPF